ACDVRVRIMAWTAANLAGEGFEQMGKSQWSNDHDSDILRGLTAGILAGIASSWVMNQFQSTWAKLMEGKEKPHGAQSLQEGSPRRGVARELAKRGSDNEEDNAAVRAGTAIEEFAFNTKLTRREKQIAGAVAHYAMGAASGAVYGVASGVGAAHTAGLGVP